uniref:C2 domain-containing protein n=1 Tax=Angiostrongylus cantonensis TaxID=6313 RepID=A0A0K0D8A2_ANGCA
MHLIASKQSLMKSNAWRFPQGLINAESFILLFFNLALITWHYSTDSLASKTCSKLVMQNTCYHNELLFEHWLEGELYCRRYTLLSPTTSTFQLFAACWGGSQFLDCCSIFEPTYVMLRGSTPMGRKTRESFPQVVMYIGDSHPEIALYPRFYLNYHDWNRIRFTQRRISMLSDNPMWKSTCFVYNWIKHVLLSPLNCTLPYFKGMLSYVDDVSVCETSVIVNDYHRIMSQKLDNYDVSGQDITCCHLFYSSFIFLDQLVPDNFVSDKLFSVLLLANESKIKCRCSPVQTTTDISTTPSVSRVLSPSCRFILEGKFL